MIMYVKKICIENYKIFKEKFEIDFNIPSKEKEGSGLTVLCGENGTGKTSILEAIGFALQDYRGDNFQIENMNDPSKDTIIKLESYKPFDVKRVLPKGEFKAKGFEFKANKRKIAQGEIYGSLIVLKGRQFIPENKEEKGYELSCDSRTPWGQGRFDDEPIVEFLDKNRIYRTRTGNNNKNNFDLMLERLSFDSLPKDKSSTKKDEKEESEHQVLIKKTLTSELEDEHPIKKTFDKFYNIFNGKLKNDKAELSLLKYHPFHPFSNSFIASVTNTSFVRLSDLGSGYEMIFSILLAIEIAKKRQKKAVEIAKKRQKKAVEIAQERKKEAGLIILLDEPELHLHPKMQEKLIELLLDISKEYQVIVSTHSPLFIKQFKDNEKTKFHILSLEEGTPKKIDFKEQVNDFLSLNEVIYMAFGLCTEEYFNELYECLLSQYGKKRSIIQFDNEFFVPKGLTQDKPSKANNNEDKKVTFITFIRNIIHHKSEYNKAGLAFTYNELEKAIELMREYAKEHKLGINQRA